MQAISASYTTAAARSSHTVPARAAQRACRAETSSRAQRRPVWQQRGRRCAIAVSARQREEQQEEREVDAWGDEIKRHEVGIMDKELYFSPMPDAIDGKSGYTPYELLDFTDIQLKHELVARVQRPLSEVYALWADRLNWTDWFGMIESVGFKEGDEGVCALNMWYRWAMTPWLELYVALRRTAEVNKYILEEPEDGMPLVVAVLFQEEEPGQFEDEEGEGEEAEGGTIVTLRVSYLLPRVLHEYAGQMAVFADVNRKLGKSMERMIEWVEDVDFEAATAAAEQGMASIREGLPEAKRLQAVEDARFELDKLRKQQQQEQQQARQEVAAAAHSAAEAKAEAQAESEMTAELEAQAVAAAAAAAEAAAAAPPPEAKRSKKAASGPIVSNPMAKRRGQRKAADGE